MSDHTPLTDQDIASIVVVLNHAAVFLNLHELGEASEKVFDARDRLLRDRERLTREVDRMREALKPLAEIEPDCMYIECRKGSNNFRGDCIRLIVDRCDRAIETNRLYVNETTEEWLRERIVAACAALAAGEKEKK